MGKRYFLTNIKETPGPFGFPMRECDLPVLPEGARTTQVIGDAATWGLAIVTLVEDNFRPIIQHAGVDTLPDVSLGVKVDALGNQARNAITGALTRRNIPTAALTAQDDYGQVIRAIGRQHDPQFDEYAV